MPSRVENTETPASYADFQSEEPGGWLRTVVQFFAIPLLIVSVAVGLYVGINMMVGSGPETAQDYVQLLQSDTINRRWQAAYELAARLGSGPVPQEFQDPRLIAALGSALERARAEKQDPPRLAMLVLRILRRLGHPDGIAPARAALGDEHDWIRSFAILALAGMEDRDSIPKFVELTAHEDHGTRQAALQALVSLDQVDGMAFRLSPDTRRAAVKHLGDLHEDVRFTAALVLADAGARAEALPVLVRMLDREALEGFQFDDKLGGLSRYKVHSNLILRAIAGVVKLGAVDDPRIAKALRRLTDDATEGDPDVREAARKALDTLKRKD